MSNLQVKNVEPDLHEQLRGRAAADGSAISEYVLALIRNDLRRPSRTDWLAAAAAAMLQKPPVEYLHTWPYAERTWSWRHNMSPYDATYVSVAEDLGATLITTDVRLAPAANGIVPVISV